MPKIIYTIIYTLMLLICQYMSMTWCTRLPLEVYELSPSSAAASTHSTDAHSNGTLHHLSLLKHQNYEYSTVNANANDPVGGDIEVAAVASNRSSNDSTTTTTNITIANTVQRNSSATHNTNAPQQLTIFANDKNANANDFLPYELDQRPSRQMLHMRQQNMQQQHIQQSIHQRAKNDASIRILYQVGESEDNLPVCAPNAVCSKIDLYETPWIERQCRCPEINRAPHIIIHHHHHLHQQQQNQNPNHHHSQHHHANNQKDSSSSVTTEQQQHKPSSEKYRSYYEREKALQHKRLLVGGDYGHDKKFESLHLKKLMQKLGAVYEDDLQLQASDYLDNHHSHPHHHNRPHRHHENDENNDAVPSSEDFHTDDGNNEDGDDAAAANDNNDNNDAQLNNNEFPHGPRRNYYAAQRGSIAPANTPAAHMRHSGHMGVHRAKEMPLIGGCPSSLGIDDGHTIADKTRHYKLCEPVQKLPICKHFRDYTWTLSTSAELNVTEQIVHCRCPRNSVTYLTKREVIAATDGSSTGYKYLFACSPQTRIRCQRKQPCKLFTVRKRQEFLDEVNINALCQCPKGHHCPNHHTQSGVISGESFLEDNIQTYSGYCMAND